MESKAGELRIGIPTGLGTNGVRKEAVEIAKRMLQEMSSKPVTCKWCKYHKAVLDPYRNWHGDIRWGNVLTAYVDDVEYAKSIMLSFDYDEVIMLHDERVKELMDYIALNKRHIG